MRILRSTLGICLALACSATLFASSASAADWKFQVRFDPQVRDEAYTGRVYLFFSRIRPQPRTGPDWFNPESFVAIDVNDWQPGQWLTFSARDADRMLAHPVPLAEMQLEGYRAQAVARFNPYERRVGTGPGNGYSAVASIDAGARRQPPEFTIDRLVRERPFSENQWCKLLKLRSSLLSDFHGRDVYLQASVILPAGYYDHPERRYPTIFNVPGFGATHFYGRADRPVAEQNRGGVEFLRVTLDPSCPLGHHVFADSANNGPYGTALVEELLPEFEKQFRAIPEPTARFLTGHSSGGWSSLWVQVNHPHDFGGTWSTAPDPVDFRDFQRIDLYEAGEDMYRNDQGDQRPLARHGDQVLIWYEDFARMEWALGYGGQLHSFEAVFSPRGDDGKPLLLWNRDSGDIDTDVAKTWEKYDIRLVLERNWDTLGPKLAGKLHVFMGELDTFYLEGATKLLKQSLEQLGSDAVVEIHPGKDHGSLLSPELQARIRGEMADAFLKANPDWGR